MRKGPSRVRVIVEPEYGERLACLPRNEPAWIADTPKNKAAVERRHSQQVAGITTFSVDSKAMPEDWLISVLNEIELHHGEYCQSKPYSELFVIGTGLSDRLRHELECYGFTGFEAMPDGFLARKMAA